MNQITKELKEQLQKLEIGYTIKIDIADMSYGAARTLAHRVGKAAGQWIAVRRTGNVLEFFRRV